MKLSTITFLFSAAMVPFAAVSATIFKCGATADFRGKDKAKNPTVPSKAMLNWMSDDLMQTFTSSYRSNEDLNMISDVFDKFTMKRETAADLSDEDGDITLSANGRSGSYLDALAAKLRGTENVGRKWYNWYYYWYRTNTKIQCNYVSESQSVPSGLVISIPLVLTLVMPSHVTSVPLPLSLWYSVDTLMTITASVKPTRRLKKSSWKPR